MDHTRALWRDFGLLPAVLVLGVFFAAVAVVAIGLDSSIALVLSVFVVVVAYCAARPHQGMEVFLAAATPGILATLVHNILGAPRWLGFLAVPLILFVVTEIDRDPPPT